MRVRSFFLAFTLVSISTTAAQTTSTSSKWTVTTQLGFHFDQVGRPERFQLHNGNMRYSSPGQAPALGLRGTYWTHRFLGYDFGITHASNRSWAGASDESSPDLTKHTIFTSATIALRSGSPDRRWQAQFRFGPAAVIHAGSGTSILTRPVDFGLTAALGGYVRVGQRLQLGLDLQNYTFQSHYGDFRITSTSHLFGEDRRMRYELVLLPTVRYWFR